MSESKTPFNKELIGLLLLFSFLVLWTIRSHAQPQLILPEKAQSVQHSIEISLKNKVVAVEMTAVSDLSPVEMRK